MPSRPSRRTPTSLSLFAIALLAGASLVACGQEAATDEAAEANPAAETREPSQQPTPEGLSAPARVALAPATSRTPEAGETIVAPGAVFAMPAEWTAQTPSSSMRLAQAAIPGEDGPGELTVFYFGPGGGGGVDANIDRWLGQMDIAAGSQPVRETFDENGFRITWVDVEGTIKPSTMGVGPTTPQPGSRLLGAVVEGPEGPWFFKATGPSATLDAQRDNFLYLLKSVRTP